MPWICTQWEAPWQQFRQTCGLVAHVQTYLFHLPQPLSCQSTEYMFVLELTSTNVSLQSHQLYTPSNHLRLGTLNTFDYSSISSVFSGENVKRREAMDILCDNTAHYVRL